MSLWDFFFGKKISIRKNLRWTGYKVPEYDYQKYWPEMKDDLVELLGTPYKFGAEVKEWPPKEIDCSELVELCFARRGIPISDGSWNQHKETYKVDSPRPGDLGFFARDSRATPSNPSGIYHVGILYSENSVIEARGHEDGKDYGKVLIRPRVNWERFPPFQNAGHWRRLKVLKRS